jgi:amino acid transporter
VAAASPGLVRAVGRWSFTALVINMIVGAGIFGLPSRIDSLVGVWGLLAYAACAAIVAGIGLCFGEVSSRFEGTGGPYLYARESFGGLLGFEVGWLMVLTRMTSLAVIANVMADYLAFFWPPAAAGWVHGAAMAMAIVALTAINLTGVHGAARVSTFLTVTKLIPMLAFVGIGLFFVDRHAFAAPPALEATPFTRAVLQLVFAFGGFEAAVIAAGEVENPRRDAPFAVLTGIAAATLLYILIQTVCIGTLPELAASKKPLADAATHFAGPVAGALVALGALVSTIGTLSGTLLSGPRALFAIAEHGQLPRLLARTHARFHTPHVAILVVAAGGLALALSGTFIYLLSLNVITRVVSYLATAAAVYVLRGRPDRPALFAVPMPKLVVPLTIAACVWLLVASSGRELRDVAIAAAIGLVVYGVGAAVRRRGEASPPAPRSSAASPP